MKRNIFFIILLLSVSMGFSQIEKTLVSSWNFTNPEYLIDNASDYCYQYTGDVGLIIVKVDVNYITSLTIYVLDCKDSYVKIYTSPDNNTYTYIDEVYDESGVFTFSVDKYASYIKLESTRDHTSGTIELQELYLTGEERGIQYTFDAAGNRISRQLIITPKSAGGGEDQKPQEFRLDNESNILLYPNPTSGILNFEITNTEDTENTEVKIKAYTINGSLILDKEFNSSSFTIDLSNEQNGTYLLDIKVNGKKRHFTIIKQ